MNIIRQWIRLWHIFFVLAQLKIDTIFFDVPVLLPFRVVAYFTPRYWRMRKQPDAVRVRVALEILGPIFVKFGQMLSTRQDLLAENYATELSKLQDQVPPFDGRLAIELLESTYKKPLKEVFSHFEIEALASASIAQVHAAVLLSGEDVVVKVLRPNVKKIIARDVGLLMMLANMVHRSFKAAKRFRLPEVVAEFQMTLLDELDLMREAASAAQLKRNFEGSNDMYVPTIYWSYTRTSILVMERIYGIPIDDMETLKERRVNLQLLAENGVKIFFTQVFRDSFFHADMHPGNIFVDITNPEQPIYTAVDFGIMGSLSDRDKYYLAENLYAFFKRDYKRVAELHIESGWVPDNTRVEVFESAIRTVCEPFFGKPLKEISFGQILIGLLLTARRFKMEIQPQLFLLQKTLVAVEGLGRKLYPDLDLWQTGQPFLEKWLRDQRSIKKMLCKMKEHLPYWLERAPEIPMLIHRLLEKAEKPSKVLVKSPSTTNALKSFLFGVLLTVAAVVAVHYR